MLKPILAGLLSLSLALLLGACGAEQPEATNEARYDVPGLEATAPRPTEAPPPVLPSPPQPGELCGSYYNDYLHLVLTLDPDGAATLSGGAEDRSGDYIQTEQGLSLTLAGEVLTAELDADGDLTLDGLTGYFLRDWDFWGITEAETGGNAVRSVRTGVSDNGDGTYRLRDFENAIAVTYPSGMTADRDAVLSGVAIGNGSGAFVTGRNVTELYSTHSGTDDEFLSDYLRSFVFADSAALYGSMEGYAELTLLHEGIEGRLAAATVTLQCGGNNVYAKAILYTSTYNDGTVNYVCKTVFAADAAEADDVAAAVTNMGAVRLRADA